MGKKYPADNPGQGEYVNRLQDIQIPRYKCYKKQLPFNPTIISLESLIFK